jgi:hypothetical protein
VASDAGVSDACQVFAGVRLGSGVMDGYAVAPVVAVAVAVEGRQMGKAGMAVRVGLPMTVGLAVSVGQPFTGCVAVRVGLPVAVSLAVMVIVDPGMREGVSGNTGVVVGLGSGVKVESACCALTLNGESSMGKMMSTKANFFIFCRVR